MTLITVLNFIISSIVLITKKAFLYYLISIKTKGGFMRFINSNIFIVILLLSMVSIISFTSCDQDNANDSTISSAQDAGQLELLSFPPTICEDPLFNSVDGDAAGYKVLVVSVANDEENLYVRVRATNNFDLNESWVFAGDCNNIPVDYNDYPYSFTHASEEDQVYVYTIPLAGLGTDICIAVHANVYSSDMTDVGSTSFGYNVDDCGTTPPPSSTCGRMTGGGSVFTIDNARVTRGFEIHCDLSKPNNIEVNWPGGNKFHLSELTSSVCTDDPIIMQEPPDAPFDTFDGRGTGKLNNVDGATIHFIFSDHGEPGKNDTALIQIWDPDGNEVLFVSGNMKHGNLQAHKDNDCQ
jgi:hypothetical protein